MKKEVHIPVLLNEVMKFLNIKENGIYVDCTLGFGGHSEAIANQLSSSTGKLIAIDQDFDAIKHSMSRLKRHNNIEFINDNFYNIDSILQKLNIEKVDGILMDLGTSYFQLTNLERGFTYNGISKLNMKMNQNQELDAIKVLNDYSEEKLIKILYEYGEEKSSHKIAKAIIDYRKTNKIIFNYQLNEIIKSVKGYVPEKNPFKNIYQAIRIEVNDELNLLRKTLLKALTLLKPFGKLAVISFHSLEDKIIKDVFWQAKQIKIESLKETIYKFKTHKTIYSSEIEIKNNNASRSAKLRTLTKQYE